MHAANRFNVRSARTRDRRFIAALVWAALMSPLSAAEIPVWDRLEIGLESSATYENPLYDIRTFRALFTAPSGRTRTINGFWDGKRNWKIRFMPDETGRWTYRTVCSDTTNSGLHGITGSFRCIPNENPLPIYSSGRIECLTGTYHLRHADGTPFFWVGCTAWNGGLKSTPEEWEHYLSHRAGHGYNVIQLVGTQWRGCASNSRGEVAFTGHGRIAINPSFFQHFDGKMDRINAHGHLAGLVLLWALPFGEGRELSPGYYLADQEAILLARYMVARYGAHHVAWILGGDGKYDEEMEDRWKHIGREVFRDKPQGISTLHPHGRLWVGKIYDDEPWFELNGYQSSHSTGKSTVEFITRTVAEGWKHNSPKPVINLEPCYEQIHNTIFEDDVRNACYWSIFSAPPSGITYGANGIWPWIREGERALNHRYSPGTSTWHASLNLPGSLQVGCIRDLMEGVRWWDLLPAQELLLEQPGEVNYRHHISVLCSPDNRQVMVYYPARLTARLRLPQGMIYEARWFDPVNNRYGDPFAVSGDGVTVPEHPFEKDGILILKGTE